MVICPYDWLHGCCSAPDLSLPLLPTRTPEHLDLLVTLPSSIPHLPFEDLQTTCCRRREDHASLSHIWGWAIIVTTGQITPFYCLTVICRAMQKLLTALCRLHYHSKMEQFVLGHTAAIWKELPFCPTHKQSISLKFFKLLNLGHK